MWLTTLVICGHSLFLENVHDFLPENLIMEADDTGEIGSRSVDQLG